LLYSSNTIFGPHRIHRPDLRLGLEPGPLVIIGLVLGRFLHGGLFLAAFSAFSCWSFMVFSVAVLLRFTSAASFSLLA